MAKEKKLYAVLTSQFCGSVDVPGDFIVVPIDDTFTALAYQARTHLTQFHYSEIETINVPPYSFINDIEWLSGEAREQLRVAECVLVRCEETVFFDLSEHMDDNAAYSPMCNKVNFIERGFQIVELMEEAGDEIYAYCQYPDTMTALDV